MFLSLPMYAVLNGEPAEDWRVRLACVMLVNFIADTAPCGGASSCARACKRVRYDDPRAFRAAPLATTTAQMTRHPLNASKQAGKRGTDNLRSSA